MSKTAVVVPSGQPTDMIELKDPAIAGLLAWLVPGLGHLYQGRTAKGILFMACILSTFFYGLAISHGRAVYASWTEDDIRLPYFCQLGVGLPALPALLQTYLVPYGGDRSPQGRNGPTAAHCRQIAERMVQDISALF